MAKETETKARDQLEVHLRNDWFSGARLLRPRDNPHFLAETALEFLPETAEVNKDGKLVKVKDLRKAPSNEELAKKDQDTVKVPAEVKKSDLNL